MKNKSQMPPEAKENVRKIMEKIYELDQIMNEEIAQLHQGLDQLKENIILALAQEIQEKRNKTTK